MSRINKPHCQATGWSGEGGIKSRLVSVLAELEASRELVAAAFVQTALESLGSFEAYPDNRATS